MKDNKRMAIEHSFQRLPEKVVVCSEADFAGRKRTRRSTSGGMPTFGNRCIKTYSQTQETSALSSGESDLYGIVKAATMGLGMKGLMADLGLEMKVRVNMDSRAARSIASRKGAGRVRHIEVRVLLVQDRVAKAELEMKKVKGEESVSDGLTKHVERAT